MSGRAAAQLEFLGFESVLHYLSGKADWIVRGLPTEPRAPFAERIRALPYFFNNLVPGVRTGWIRLTRREAVSSRMRDDLRRLSPDDPVPTVADRDGVVRAVVLDGNGVLLGAIERQLAGRRAIEMMVPAPQTIRPDMTPALAKTLLASRPYILITTARGGYLGRYDPPAS